jgi:hypothetical protein
MSYDPENFKEFARDHGLQEPLPALILPSGSTTFSDTARKLFSVLARRHRYFVRGKTIVEIAFNKVLKDKQAHDVFQILDPDALRSRIDHEFSTVAWREKGGEFIKKPARISHDAAVVLLKTDEAYRFLTAITTLALARSWQARPENCKFFTKVITRPVAASMFYMEIARSRFLQFRKPLP